MVRDELKALRPTNDSSNTLLALADLITPHLFSIQDLKARLNSCEEIGVHLPEAPESSKAPADQRSDAVREQLTDIVLRTIPELESPTDRLVYYAESTVLPSTGGYIENVLSALDIVVSQANSERDPIERAQRLAPALKAVMSEALPYLDESGESVELLGLVWRTLPPGQAVSALVGNDNLQSLLQATINLSDYLVAVDGYQDEDGNNYNNTDDRLGLLETLAEVALPRLAAIQEETPLGEFTINLSTDGSADSNMSMMSIPAIQELLLEGVHSIAATLSSKNLERLGESELMIDQVELVIDQLLTAAKYAPVDSVERLQLTELCQDFADEHHHDYEVPSSYRNWYRLWIDARLSALLPKEEQEPFVAKLLGRLRIFAADQDNSRIEAMDIAEEIAAGYPATDPKRGEILAQHILPYMQQITTDDFTTASNVVDLIPLLASIKELIPQNNPELAKAFAEQATPITHLVVLDWANLPMAEGVRVAHNVLTATPSPQPALEILETILSYEGSNKLLAAQVDGMVARFQVVLEQLYPDQRSAVQTRLNEHLEVKSKEGLPPTRVMTTLLEYLVPTPASTVANDNSGVGAVTPPTNTGTGNTGGGGASNTQRLLRHHGNGMGL